MVLTDYNKRKKLEVTSQNDSNTTQDKAQPILLSDGDDSTTGTGDIIIDFTNVSSDSDIAVYDQNGNLLPYEIENRTSTGAVLWVYNSWTRDDSVQAQIVYGDGPTSSEENVTGTWNNTGQNVLMEQHLQDDPLTATDSTANNNDGTVNGPVSSSTAQFGNSASTDGSDDYIALEGNMPEISGSFAVSLWTYHESSSAGGNNSGQQTPFSFNDSAIKPRAFVHADFANNAFEFDVEDSNNSFTTLDSTTSPSTGEWYHLVAEYDDSNTEITLYVDAVNEASSSHNGTTTGGNDNVHISRQGDPVDGFVDEVKVYDSTVSSEEVQAEYDASPKGGQVYFSQQSAEEITPAADVSDFNDSKKLKVFGTNPGQFNKVKDLEVTSRNDSNSTISKAQPVIVAKGNQTESKQDSGATEGEASTLSWGVETKTEGFIDEVGFESDAADSDVSIFIRNSGGDILASKEVAANAGEWKTVSFSESDYSRLLSSNEQVVVEVSSNLASLEEATSDSFSGKLFEYTDTNPFRSYQLYSATQSSSGGTQVSFQEKISDDESKTGTGDIYIDWSNISSKKDLAVFDQNGNLLPYEVENFNPDKEEAVLWVYNDWTRDDSVQAKIGYGDGGNTNFEDVEGTWENEGQNAVIVQHLGENAGEALDSTSNNNDGTVNGPSQGVSGSIGGAYSFDGNDEVSFSTVSDLSVSNDLTIVLNANFDSQSSSSTEVLTEQYRGSSDRFNIVLTDESTPSPGITVYNGNFHFQGGGSISTGEYTHLVGTWDSSATSPNMFVDATSVSGSTRDSVGNENGFKLGSDVGGASGHVPFPGDMDEARYYNEQKSSAWIQADYDATPKAGQVFFSQQAASTPSVTSGTETVSKAQPIILVDGSLNHNGFGDIRIDFGDVNDKTDLAVFDEDGFVLPYEVESLNNQSAVLWVYNDWVRDGTVQAEVAFGNGSEDNSVTGSGSNPWEQGQNTEMVQHLNDLDDDPATSDTVFDSTSNDNDGTVDGATSTSGPFNGAGSFDGADDEITVTDDSSIRLTEITIAGFFKLDTDTTNSRAYGVRRIGNYQVYTGSSSNELRFFDGNNGVLNSNFVANINEYYSISVSASSNGREFYIDSNLENSDSGGSDLPTSSGNLFIGSVGGGDYWPGDIDALRIYSTDKNAEWHQADYDASPKGKRKFFKQEQAESVKDSRTTFLKEGRL